MRIVNGTDEEIAYELRGGPHRMTLSECDLEPGEIEVWESPYRHAIDCVLIVRAGDDEARLAVGEQASVRVVRGADGLALVPESA